MSEEEEGTKPFMSQRQKDNLTALDKFNLATALSKFCAKNCGFFKREAENVANTSPECLSEFYLFFKDFVQRNQ